MAAGAAASPNKTSVAAAFAPGSQILEDLALSYEVMRPTISINAVGVPGLNFSVELVGDKTPTATFSVFTASRVDESTFATCPELCADYFVVPVLCSALIPVWRPFRAGFAGTPPVLSLDVLWGIASGAIRYWNDSRISSIQPNSTLTPSGKVELYMSRTTADLFTNLFAFGARPAEAGLLSGVTIVRNDDVAFLRTLFSDRTVALVPRYLLSTRNARGHLRMVPINGSVPVTLFEDNDDSMQVAAEGAVPAGLAAVAKSRWRESLRPDGALKGAWPLTYFISAVLRDVASSSFCRYRTAVADFAHWLVSSPDIRAHVIDRGAVPVPVKVAEDVVERLSAARCGGEALLSSTGGTVDGGGSSLAADMYSELSFLYRFTDDHEVALRYEATSSGRGRAALLSGALAFAGSDVPLSAAERATPAGAQVVTFPFLATALVPIVNVPALGELSPLLAVCPRTLAAIFAGVVTRWNDPAVASCNDAAVAARLPNATIRVVVRAGGSGTAQVWSHGLAAFAPDLWNASARVMANGSIAWPVGRVLEGTTLDATAVVDQTPDSIGFAPASFASDYSIAAARIGNASAGQPVAYPNISAVEAAYQNVSAQLDEVPHFIARPGVPTQWPLCSTTYLMVRSGMFVVTGPAAEAPPNETVALACAGRREFLRFVLWAVSNRAIARRITVSNFVLLAATLRDSVTRAAFSVSCGGRPLLRFCASGEYYDERTRDCRTCGPGTFSPSNATVCKQCPIGKYEPTAGAGACTDCDRLHYGVLAGAADMAAACAPCPKDAVSAVSGATSREQCKCTNGLFKDAAGECRPCSRDDGVDPDACVAGTTLETLPLLPGRWRRSASAGPDSVLRCPTPALCVGGANASAYCAEGATGTLCKECPPGFAKDLGSARCRPCDSFTAAGGVLLLVGTAGVVLLAFLALRFERALRWAVVACVRGGSAANCCVAGAGGRPRWWGSFLLPSRGRRDSTATDASDDDAETIAGFSVASHGAGSVPSVVGDVGTRQRPVGDAAGRRGAAWAQHSAPVPRSALLSAPTGAQAHGSGESLQMVSMRGVLNPMAAAQTSAPRGQQAGRRLQARRGAALAVRGSAASLRRRVRALSSATSGAGAGAGAGASRRHIGALAFTTGGAFGMRSTAWLRRKPWALGGEEDVDAAEEELMREELRQLGSGLTEEDLAEEERHLSAWLALTWHDLKLSLVAKLKLVVTHLQIALGFGLVLNVEFPASYSGFLESLAFVNFSADRGVALFGCGVDNVSYFSRFLIATLTPIAVFAAVAAVVLARFAAVRLGFVPIPRGHRRRTVLHRLLHLPAMDPAAAGDGGELFSEDRLARYAGLVDVFGRAGATYVLHVRTTSRNALLTAFVTLSYLTYPAISRLVVRYWDCDDRVTPPSLRADYRVRCDSDEYRAFAPVAVLMGLMYPVGVPLALFVLLARYRHHFNPRARWMRPILRDAAGTRFDSVHARLDAAALPSREEQGQHLRSARMPEVVARAQSAAAGAPERGFVRRATSTDSRLGMRAALDHLTLVVEGPRAVTEAKSLPADAVLASRRPPAERGSSRFHSRRHSLTKQAAGASGLRGKPPPAQGDEELGAAGEAGAGDDVTAPAVEGDEDVLRDELPPLMRTLRPPLPTARPLLPRQCRRPLLRPFPTPAAPDHSFVIALPMCLWADARERLSFLQRLEDAVPTCLGLAACIERYGPEGGVSALNAGRESGGDGGGGGDGGDGGGDGGDASDAAESDRDAASEFVLRFVHVAREDLEALARVVSQWRPHGDHALEDEVYRRVFLTRLMGTYGALVAAYEPRAWYFEIVEQLRRLVMSTLIAYGGEDTNVQVVVAILLAMAFAAVFHLLEPFTNYSDDLLAVSSQWCLAVVLLAALVLRTKAFEDAQIHSASIGAVLIAITALVLGAAVLQAVGAVMRARRAFARRRLRFRHRCLMRHQLVLEEELQAQDKPGAVDAGDEG